MSTVLLIARDETLHEEAQSAITSLGSQSPLAHYEWEIPAGVEAIRSRNVDLVILEYTPHLADLRSIAREVQASAPNARIIVALPTASQGSPELEGGWLIEAVRCGVNDFLHRPVSSVELSATLARIARPSAAKSPPVGKLIAFFSNKGGVGKSTLSINVACGLAQKHPGRVLLVDAALQLGVTASTLDLQPKTTIADAVRERDRLDETLLRQLTTAHPCGLHLLSAPRDAMEAVEIDDASLSRVLMLARRAYDVVVVDTFPVFDRVALAILDLCDRAYLVFENVVPTLLGAVKLVELLNQVGFPAEKQRVVLNKFTQLPGSLSAADVSVRLGFNADFVLPYDKNVIVAANTGRPYALNPSRWFGYGPPLRQLIEDAESLVLVDSKVYSARNGHAATVTESAKT